MLKPVLILLVIVNVMVWRVRFAADNIPTTLGSRVISSRIRSAYQHTTNTMTYLRQ